MNSIFTAFSLATAGLVLTTAPTTAALVDDHQISVETETDLKPLRQRLIQFIWGQESLPNRMPDKVALAESPMANVENLEKVESILISMDAGQQTIAFNLEFDAIATNHMISGYASTNLILSQLNGKGQDKGGAVRNPKPAASE